MKCQNTINNHRAYDRVFLRASISVAFVINLQSSTRFSVVYCSQFSMLFCIMCTITLALCIFLGIAKDWRPRGCRERKNNHKNKCGSLVSSYSVALLCTAIRATMFTYRKIMKKKGRWKEGKATPFLSVDTHTDSHLQSIYKNRKKGGFFGHPNQQLSNGSAAAVCSRPFTSFRRLLFCYFLLHCRLRPTARTFLCFFFLPSEDEGRKRS